VDGLGERFGVALPGGPWSDPPDRAVIVPIRSNIAHYLAGFLVVGISSRLQFDQAYESFVELAATQIANAIATARAYEEERQRAEALAELDRVKTAFFSNVSHEFRTPLTLMLGPVEELLSKSEGELSADVRSELQLVNRNAYRLLRLVNTLLDFSRIEAGRTQASYEPVDVGEITADLASVFRAATERAGLELIIDCPKLAGPVFVDRDMWEKIVLNLISNAFKFTFEGAIEVSVRQREDGEGRGVVELQVRDTGVGIPPEEMPRLFDRFHRIESTRSRTHEGTGIGLALVQELVKLHGGSVRADSVLGKGTLFTVSLPLGSAHLPAERIGVERTLVSTNAGAVPFVEEALRWLPEAASDDARSKFNVQGSSLSEENIDWELRAVPESKIQNLKSKILVADDNADMRQYLTRILSERYDVTSVPNGKVAIEAARERLPDLVLSDVMMPELDGFGLLKALRADQRTAMVPIVLLSARAGEESRVEGMEAGADDYLTKPFSARELLARVSARLEIARIRREAAAEQQAAYEALREADRRKDEFLAMLGHELRNPFGIISNGVQLLRRIAPREPKLQDVQEMIERQLAHTSRLLDDLLDVSRIARGKIQLERQSYRLDEIVRQTLADHRSVFEERKIRLDAELPEGAVWVLADSTRIAQAFGNLLSNAAKFTDASGTVAVKLASERDEFAVLSVRDTGMGIEPEFLGRIFESFIQAESSLDRTRGGLGLGLALVKGIIELHGGRVSASSDGPGRGSEFTIRLPLDKSQSSKALSPSAEHAGIRPYRILLIEDNQLAARSTRLLLEQFGHTVEVAHDGIVGLEIARRFHPEVILCDIGLPGLDGYGVASSLREQLQRDGAYLVAVSGYAKDEGRAREAGFNVHLTKPINFRKLEELLARFAANVPEEGETGVVASVAVTRSTG
jgi:signal transduction histidine kinase